MSTFGVAVTQNSVRPKVDRNCGSERAVRAASHSHVCRHVQGLPARAGHRARMITINV
jgi:hypothetical protein